MSEIWLNHSPCRKLNSISKADCEANKSDDLLKRNFKTATPMTRYMTKIKANDGKLYISAIFECFDYTVLELAIDTNSNTMITNLG